MKIFNTMTRKKEELTPLVPGEYRIYVCGPTVYNYVHIGNARPVVVFDTLRRYLEYQGNRVLFVSNITELFGGFLYVKSKREKRGHYQSG